MGFAHRLSLRARLVLLVLATVVPFVGMLAWNISNDFLEARNRAQMRTGELAAIVAARIETTLGEVEDVLTRMAERSSIRALDRDRCDPIISEYVRLHPKFTTLALRDREGNLICSHIRNAEPRMAPGQFPFMEEGLRNAKFTVGNAVVGPQTAQWVSILTYPIVDASGGTSGLLVMPVDLLALSRRIFHGVPENLLVIVADRDGKYLMRSRDHESRVGKAIPARLAERLRGADHGNGIGYGGDGVKRLFTFTTVPGSGWRVFVGMPEEGVLAIYRSEIATDFAFGIPLLVMVLAAAWWISSAIANPIRGLARTAGQVAEGDTRARATLEGPREVEQVARQFNRMLDALARQREERAALVGHFGQLAKVAPEIILLIEPGGRIVEANEAAAAAYGYSLDELRGMHVLDLRTPVDETLLAQQLQAADSPDGVLFETFHRRKDGSTFPVEVRARSLEIDGKRYRQSFVRDVTARQQAKDAIRESEVRFRTVVESAPDGIFIQTRGSFAWLNREAMRIFGFATMEEALGHSIADHFDPDSRELAQARIRLVNEEHRSVGNGELTAVRPDGSCLAVETSAVPFTYEGENGALVYVRDITDRKRALEELRRSEHRFRTLVEDVPNIAVQGYDHERRVVFWNAASEALYGFTREEATGRKLEDLIIPAPMREAVIAATTLWATRCVPIPASELTLRRKDDSPITVFSSHAMLVNHHGDREMYCIDVDLTALKRAEAELVEWKHRYEAAILASGQLLRDWNPNTNEMSIIGDTQRILGFGGDEMAGGLPRWKELIHPDDREVFDREFDHAICTRGPFHQHYRVGRKDGAWLTMQDDGYFLLDHSGAISRMVCFVVDITERSRAQGRIEEQLNELRRWHAAMLGRETRILELKREVNDLLAAAGAQSRYGVAEPDGTGEMA